MKKTTLHAEFPTVFPLKAMGKNETGFESLVLSIVQKHLPEDDEARVSTRLSRNGNYLSVTVTFMAQDKSQLDAIYQELGDHERVLMLL
jgi:putative lipoic acid-binding regulatory protein